MHGTKKDDDSTNAGKIKSFLLTNLHLESEKPFWQQLNRHLRFSGCCGSQQLKLSRATQTKEQACQLVFVERPVQPLGFVSLLPAQIWGLGCISDVLTQERCAQNSLYLICPITVFNCLWITTTPLVTLGPPVLLQAVVISLNTENSLCKSTFRSYVLHFSLFLSPLAYFMWGFAS